MEPYSYFPSFDSGRTPERECSSTIVLSENCNIMVIAPPRTRHLRGPRACSRLQIDAGAPLREAASIARVYLRRREIVPLLHTQHHFFQNPAWVISPSNALDSS